MLIREPAGIRSAAASIARAASGAGADGVLRVATLAHCAVKSVISNTTIVFGKAMIRSSAGQP
jgi:hypothetical protein